MILGQFSDRVINEDLKKQIPKIELVFGDVKSQIPKICRTPTVITLLRKDIKPLFKVSFSNITSGNITRYAIQLTDN